MSSKWPTMELRQLLSLDLHRVHVDPTGTYPMVGVYSFGRGLFHREPVSGGKTSYKYFYRLESDHIVMSQLFGWEGALALSSDEFAGRFVSPQFPTFRCDPSKLDRIFLGWYIRRPVFWAELATRTRGMGDRRRTLGPEALLTCSIPLPPLAEQRRIVARIADLAAKIEEARDLRQQAADEGNAIVETTARRIFAGVDARETELRSWLDRAEDGIQTGPFGAQLGSADFMESGVPVITIGNVQYGGLRLDRVKCVTEEKAKELDRYRVRRGDILFARMGTVGRCCIVPPEAEGWLFNYHIIRVALDKSRVEPRYVHWTIRASAEVGQYLDEKIRGATRKGVNSIIVAGLPCRIPSITEQRRIVAYLDDLQAKTDALKRLQIKTAAEVDALLPSILDKAFKGEL